MIILDTNVVSEPMKPKGNNAVQEWLDDQVSETLYLTTISLSELMVGIEILPEGRRKQGLITALNRLLTGLFEKRILAFDHPAALKYPRLFARSRAAGQPISGADCQIAAIAAAHGFKVATRDTQPFTNVGIPVINPWTANVS